jgi:hypothetical protein
VARPIRYDVMRKRAQRYLHKNETIQAIFRATTAGPKARAVVAGMQWLVLATLAGTLLLVHSLAGLIIDLAVLVLAYSLLIAIMRFRYVVATGQRILVVKVGSWTARTRGIRTELPRATRLGPPSPPWHMISAGGEILYVNERYFDAVALADDPARPAPDSTVSRRCASCGRIIEPDEPARLVSGMELAHNICPDVRSLQPGPL